MFWLNLFRNNAKSFTFHAFPKKQDMETKISTKNLILRKKFRRKTRFWDEVIPT